MDKHVKKKGGGFTKPCALSPQLQEFLGVPELARTEVVKRLWGYIREKNLQNPKNKRKILCDEALHGIFRVRSIDMFQMNKVLSKHIWPLDEAEATLVKSSQKKRQRESREEDLDHPKRKEKLQKGEDPSDRRTILCDQKLKELFNVDSFHGFGVSKLLTAHFVKTQRYLNKKSLSIFVQNSS
ncbi:SWIB complex BAF60b domain-containing protein [Forsythia ovata]|uniref:SWIB complex BAF60b domain-containing protein n=1 Tax=Forsythia ovata TaxID=205694 RepID=A0ABD1QMS8_9LAMI